MRSHTCACDGSSRRASVRIWRAAGDMGITRSRRWAVLTARPSRLRTRCAPQRRRRTRCQRRRPEDALRSWAGGADPRSRWVRMRGGSQHTPRDQRNDPSGDHGKDHVRAPCRTVALGAMPNSGGGVTMPRTLEVFSRQIAAPLLARVVSTARRANRRAVVGLRSRMHCRLRVAEHRRVPWNPHACSHQKPLSIEKCRTHESAPRPADSRGTTGHDCGASSTDTMTSGTSGAAL